MMASRYIDPFKDEATFWTLKMSFCAEVGESGCRGAGFWMYLEAVFTTSASLPGKSCREKPSASRAARWTGRAAAAC